jgi:hypothetical protein
MKRRWWIHHRRVSTLLLVVVMVMMMLLHIMFGIWVWQYQTRWRVIHSSVVSSRMVVIEWISWEDMVGNAGYDMVGESKMGGNRMHQQCHLVLEDSYPSAINS